MASLFARDEARAGHDGTNIFHLGEYNVVPPDASLGTTLLDANVSGRALDVRNSGTAENAGGVEAWSHGGGPAIQGNALVSGAPAAVLGVSWASPSPEDFGKGSSNGVVGQTGSGTGVSGNSDTGFGVQGRSEHGVGGFFSTLDGYALQTGGPVHVGANWNNFAFSADNLSTEEAAGGIYATGRGGKPALEADHLGDGVAVQGVSWCCDQFGQGPGTGVQGISGSGNGVEGRSDSGFGGYFTTNGGNGVSGTSRDGAGVEGISRGDPASGPDGSVGVRGVSVLASEDEPAGHGLGTGVKGVSGTGAGVLGIARDAGTGVEARTESPDGLALKTSGRSAFSTAGSGAVSAGADTAFVANPAVTAQSHITVTLCGDTGGSVIVWLDRNPGVGFTVHLSAAVKKKGSIPLTYFIVEPS